MKRSIRWIVCCAAIELGAVCLSGCSSSEPADQPRVAAVQNGPTGASEAQAAPMAAPSADVQTLQDNAKRDQQTLNEANKAVNVLGGK